MTDFTIVNVALPSMQRDLHVATTTLQWVVEHDYKRRAEWVVLRAIAMPDLLGMEPAARQLRKVTAATAADIGDPFTPIYSDIAW